ncbi:hypothetical protein CMALT430_300001 [Carnobacterium maltaromaticum]|nr:hypothetical protein CMALT430_300001 [Carnobacterium maltaromaticum]
MSGFFVSLKVKLEVNDVAHKTYP